MCYVLSCCLEGFGTWTFWYWQHINILIAVHSYRCATFFPAVLKVSELEHSDIDSISFWQQFIPVDVLRSFLQFWRFRNLDFLISTAYYYFHCSLFLLLCFALFNNFSHSAEQNRRDDGWRWLWGYYLHIRFRIRTSGEKKMVYSRWLLLKEFLMLFNLKMFTKVFPMG